jgi:hypothetical protein
MIDCFCVLGFGGNQDGRFKIAVVQATETGNLERNQSSAIHVALLRQPLAFSQLD